MIRMFTSKHHTGPVSRRIAWVSSLILPLVGMGLIAKTHIAVAQTGQSAPSMHWYKGNTHTHTMNGDSGDSSPDEVVRWYRTHGYQFVVITDHEFLTHVDGLNALFGAEGKFLVIQGQELTSGNKEGLPAHVNGLGVTRVTPLYSSSSVLDMLQHDVAAIRAAGGVPQINHPNLGFDETADDLIHAGDYKLLEIDNAHPTANNFGGGGKPSVEELWDQVLTSGKLVYGVASDDSHIFKDPGNPNVPAPGRGWVVVRAPRLDAQSILASLERGDFYASNGVELEDVIATSKSLTVKVKEKAKTNTPYTILFIGKGGKILDKAITPTATYTFKGDEGYVRADVIDSNGRRAWVQPVLVTSNAR